MSLVTKLIHKLCDRWEIEPHDLAYAVTYLERYGYLDAKPTITSIVKAVKLFQKLRGALKSDGVLGRRTLATMKVPRCGCPDVKNGKPLALKRERPNPWYAKGVKVVRWGFREYLPGMSKAEQRDGFAEALQAWRDVCGLKTEFVANPKGRMNVAIGLAHPNARSPRIRSDGRGGMLAATYLADFRGMIPLDFDPTSHFQIGVAPGQIDYVRVAMHEAGHVFMDLEHSAVDRTIALLDPTYSEAVGTPQPEDVARAVQKWGKPEAVSPSSDGEQEYVIRCQGPLKIEGHTVLKRASR